MRKPVWTAIVVVFLGACAEMPPERVERDRAILAAVKPCKVRYGAEGMMTVSTRSSLTMARADYAGRAGLRIVAESPSTRALINGKNVLVPYARARSVQVGEAYVEPLHIVVHDAHLSETAVDGVLGNSFLALFKVNIDRRNNRLTLEPLP